MTKKTMPCSKSHDIFGQIGDNMAELSSQEVAVTMFTAQNISGMGPDYIPVEVGPNCIPSQKPFPNRFRQFKANP